MRSLCMAMYCLSVSMSIVKEAFLSSYGVSSDWLIDIERDVSWCWVDDKNLCSRAFLFSFATWGCCFFFFPSTLPLYFASLFLTLFPVYICRHLTDWECTLFINYCCYTVLPALFVAAAWKITSIRLLSYDCVISKADSCFERAILCMLASLSEAVIKGHTSHYQEASWWSNIIQFSTWLVFQHHYKGTLLPSCLTCRQDVFFLVYCCLD